MAKRYVIVGDTEMYTGFLVCTAGHTRERAEETLSRMKNAPSDNDKLIMKGHSNLRIKEVEQEECWWE